MASWDATLDLQDGTEASPARLEYMRAFAPSVLVIANAYTTYLPHE